MLPWKGSRKSCHILGQWLLIFFAVETPLRKWVVTCAFLFTSSAGAFCPEPVSFHSPNPLWMSPPIPYQEPGRSSFFCHWVFGSSITPQAELMLPPELWDNHTWAAPHPDWAQMCPPTRRSCKNRDLWRTHVKTAQQNVRAEVSLTLFFEASQHFLFFSPPYTTAPKSSGALLNRPQSLLGGRRAMKTKAHHRSWQQRSTQYPSKMKLYSFRMTKR